MDQNIKEDDSALEDLSKKEIGEENEEEAESSEEGASPEDSPSSQDAALILREWRHRPRPWILYDKMVRVCQVPGPRWIDRTDELQLIRTFLALWVDVVAFDPGPSWLRLRPHSPFAYHDSHPLGVGPVLEHLWGPDKVALVDELPRRRRKSDEVDLQLPQRAEAAAQVTLNWCRHFVAELSLCPWAQASLDFTEVPHLNEDFPAAAVRIKVVPAEWGWQVFERVVRESATELLQLTGYFPPALLPTEKKLQNEPQQQQMEMKREEDNLHVDPEIDVVPKKEERNTAKTKQVEEEEEQQQQQQQQEQQEEEEEEVETVNAELVNDHEEKEKQDGSHDDDEEDDDEEGFLHLVEDDDDEEEEDEDNLEGLFRSGNQYDDDDDDDEDDDMYEVRVTPKGDVFSAFPLVDPNLAITFVVAAPMTSSTESGSMEEWTDGMTPDFDFLSFYQLATTLEDDLLEEAETNLSEEEEPPQEWSEIPTGHLVTLAPFHPHWQFATSESEDKTPLDYEKKTPLPTISLVRTSAIEAAGGPAATERIATYNQKVLLEMGIPALQKLYRDKVFSPQPKKKDGRKKNV